MRIEPEKECTATLAVVQAGSVGQADLASRPPTVTNRGAVKFQGSEDTIVLALYIAWNEEWPDRLKFFEECKAAAADDQTADGGFFDLGGWECEVKEHGAGGRGKGPRRAFVIEAVGLIFEFSRTDSPNGETPNGKVMAGSLTCMKLGPLGVLGLVHEFIEALGGRVLANKLTRIDGAVDLPGVDVVEFITRYLADCCLCRARKYSLNGESGRHQTLTVGRSPQVRIYDKAIEMWDRPDPAKLEYLKEHRWNGEHPYRATRVEFQLRRDDLKSVEFDGQTINSLEDYLACRAGLCAYLCNWFRLTVDPVDPNHRDRAETWPQWAEVSDAFAAWATSPAIAVTRVKRPRPIDEESLGSIVVGCGLSMCANEEQFTLKALKRSLLKSVDALVKEHGEEEVQRRWWIKRQRQLVAMPPEKDRRGRAKPKGQNFESWLAERDAYREAVEAAGGQMPFEWSGDPLQFIDLKTIVGD